jgi:DNA-binding NarL/FixJ family response regulator
VWNTGPLDPHHELKRSQTLRPDRRSKLRLCVAPYSPSRNTNPFVTSCAVQLAPLRTLGEHVLFVGDEPAMLDGIGRVVESNDNGWDVAYAPDGGGALMLLEATPFDLVVSDIRMPGMAGPALLKMVCEKYAAIVRIALSQQAEINDALRAVSVAHQFLVKPCDLDMLRIAIERVTSLSNILSNKLLNNVVGSVKDPSVPPRTYVALGELLRREPGVIAG